MESWEFLRKMCEPPSHDIEVPSDARRVFNQAMGAWIEEGAHGFWYEPGVDGHSDPKHFVCTIAGRLSALSEVYNSNPTGSPIEDQLLGALLWLYMDWADFPRIDNFDGPAEHRKRFSDNESDVLEFWITPQAKIGKYKADFLLWFRIGKHIGGLAVECDGHAFHEKNKEQAAKDKARDRAFIQAGYPALRFTGSEIFNNPLGCVEQIKDALAPVLDRVSRDGGVFGA